MKSKLFFTSFAILLLSFSAWSQDTLFLTVKAMKKTSPVLKFADKPLNSEDSLKVGKSNWFLNVATSLDIKVVVSNMQGNSDSVILTHFPASFAVKGDSLRVDGKFLKLSSTFRIVVRNKTKDTTLRSFDLSYNNSANGSKGFTGPGGDPIGAAGYRVGAAIHDAFALANPKTEASLKKMILSYYDSGETDITKLKDAYSRNPFLKGEVNLTLSKAFQEGAGLSLSSILSSAGGLDVTNIADGLAKFVVKRTKEELTIYFFNRLKQTLEKPEFRDLKTLFPQTVQLLELIGDEVYNYQTYIQNLREAFKADFETLDQNLPGIIPNHQPFFDKHKELDIALLSACYVTSELKQQAHPGDILANYPDTILNKLGDKNYYKGAMQTLQLLSESLKDTSSADNAPYWVSTQKIRDLASDKKVFRIYLGLLYQRALLSSYGPVYYTAKDSLIGYLDTVAAHYDQGIAIYSAYKNYVLKFGEKIDAINKLVKSGGVSGDSANTEKYVRYFRTTVDMIEYCTAAGKLPFLKDIEIRSGFKLDQLQDTLRRWFDVSYNVADLVTDVTRKNYSSAINHAIFVYNAVMVKQRAGEVDTLTKLVAMTDKVKAADMLDPAILKKADSTATAKGLTLTAEQRKDTASKALKDSLTARTKDNETASSTLNGLVSYGAFIASIATAKNSDEVEKAIEAAAMPSGSSRVKRESAFNVALNAYTGLFYGHESIEGIKDGLAFNSYGVTVPIGVAISFGQRKWYGIDTGGHWSYSLFVSLLDIGAVAAYRLKDDTTAQVPTIQLKNILSPGAFLSIGFPKSPFSLNLGAQLGPNLRKVYGATGTQQSNDYENKLYWRFSASFCVDIPLLNFSTKSRLKK